MSCGSEDGLAGSFLSTSIDALGSDSTLVFSAVEVDCSRRSCDEDRSIVDDVGAALDDCSCWPFESSSGA